MNLTEVLKQPDGFTPPDVTVTIEKVFPYKSGESENGPWSFQDIQVTGGKLKLKGLHEFPESRVGQTVTIRANQSKQHGLTGMKVAHEEYKDKIYDKLIITSSAKWEWGSTNGNGSAPTTGAAPVTQNGHVSDTAYADHVLACAELANLVMGNLSVDDPAAIQACFATICIDTKNRNLLLPKPKTLAVTPELSAPDEPPFDPQQENPFEDDPVPF